MKAIVDTRWGRLELDFSKGFDISLPIISGGGASAWYLNPPVIEPVRENGFLGSVAEGGCVNFRNVFFNPHGHGTHTECVGHITHQVHSIRSVNIAPMLLAQVVTVLPEHQETTHGSILPDDLIITKKMLEKAIHATPPDALIVRTLPNSNEKATKNYSATNPPYFHPDAMQWMRDVGILHLLTDLPSVDKEEDGGALAGHHNFWNMPELPDLTRTISELIYVPNHIPDGLYLLNLQLASFENDATPSRPIIFSFREVA